MKKQEKAAEFKHHNKKVECTLKKIILLGDSIRISYQDGVREKLGSEYEIWSPDDNCRFAGYTLFELPRWKEELSNADVIHWNNGLWDVIIRHPEDGSFTSRENYMENILKIHRELRKTNAKIIFALTTPVDPRNPVRNNETIEEYNQIVKEYLTPKGVLINDLYSLLYPNIESCIQNDYVHLTPDGCKLCADAVSKMIRECCNKSFY